MFMAAQRALQIQDIIREICEHISPRPISDDLGIWKVPDRTTQRVLLCFALTCRATVDPALDKLWWSVDDLTPLFKLMPDFIPGSPGYFNCHLTSETEFCSFERYAKRVRFYHSKMKEKVHSSAYFQVIRARNNQPLLPLLRYIHADVVPTELFMLLSTSLCSLKITNSHSSKASNSNVVSIIFALPGGCPSLQALDIGEDVIIPDTCIDAICKLDSTRRLAFSFPSLPATTQLTSENLAKLSKMPHPTHFLLHGDLVISADAILPSASPFFPALEHLELCSIASNIDETIKLLNLAKFKQLRHFHFRSPKTGQSYRDWKALHLQFAPLFKALREHTSSSFTSLTIEVPRSMQRICLSDVPDLLQLKLTELRFERQFFFSLSHEDLLQMIAAWPSLRVLELVSEQWSTNFETLICIATNLPDLTELKIGAELQNLPPVANVSVFSHPLRKFTFTPCSTRKGSPALSAQLIDRMFPFIESLELVDSKEICSDEVSWKENFLEVMNVVRNARADQMQRMAFRPFLGDVRMLQC